MRNFIAHTFWAINIEIYFLYERNSLKNTTLTTSQNTIYRGNYMH